MKIAYQVSPPRHEEDTTALARVLGVSFNCDADRLRDNFELAGPGFLRTVRDGERVVGGLILVPMGQWFGGRSVPMHGIAAVGIDPAWRGRGAGSALMCETVRGLHADGVALSTLYPATVPVYRGAGYELAGSRWHVRMPLKGVRARAGELPVRAADSADFTAMTAAYSNFASRHDGMLDRGDYIWNRVRFPQKKAAFHHVVEEDGALTGYVSFTHLETSDGMYELSLKDIVINSGPAGRRLLSLLGAHQSMAGSSTFYASPNHPLLTMQPEWRAKITLQMHWMTRVVHVDAALTARGYPVACDAELHLDIIDELVPENAGRRVLTVSNGRGTVEPGGSGRLRLDVRGLAALFTGFARPDALELQGLVDGPPGDLALAAAVFAGPAPWMPSMF